MGFLASGLWRSPASLVVDDPKALNGPKRF